MPTAFGTDSDALGAADRRRPAGHQSSLRGRYQLPAHAANADSLPHRDLPAAKLEHQELAMNGDLRYTIANMNLPNYYDSFQG